MRRTGFRLAVQPVFDISRVATLLVVTTLLAGCGHDAADREYIAALRGEEEGMTREQQIALIDRAIAIKPGRAWYYETRGGYRVDTKQFDRALSDFNRAIELAPRPYLYYRRGLTLCQAGEIERAIPDFDRAIEGQSENTQFYRGRSLARAALGNASGALADAEQLVKRAPQQAESWYARGVALALLGRDADAVVDFTQARAIRPELVYVVEARAQSFERLGQRENARSDQDTLARLRADNAGCAMCLDPFRY